MSIRERIARAITPHYEKVPQYYRDNALRLADAVLEAIREPTYEMAIAGGCELPDSENATTSELAEDAAKVWKAMLTAASDSGRHPEGENGAAG